MNCEDEEYVRFFTRDTVSWRALKWEGQCVLALMLHGKFDRSGVFDCDGHDPSHAVTLVTDLPAEVVTVGLSRLLESKTWVLRDGLIVWPKFMHAQTCRRSDRMRQVESRDNRRLEALGQPSQLSPRVTRGHTESHAVTLSRAEQIRSEISDQRDPPTPSVLAPQGAKPKKPRAVKTPAARWRRFPTDFEPDESHRKLAAERGVDLAEALAKIRDHEFKELKSDAAATLRTWIRNDRNFAPNLRKTNGRGPMQGDHGLTGFEGTHLTSFEGRNT